MNALGKQIEEKLAAAEKLVQEALALVPESAHTCRECHATVKDNFVDWRAHEELGGALTKLTRFKKALQNGSWEPGAKKSERVSKADMAEAP